MLFPTLYSLLLLALSTFASFVFLNKKQPLLDRILGMIILVACLVEIKMIYSP